LYNVPSLTDWQEKEKHRRLLLQLDSLPHTANKQASMADDLDTAQLNKVCEYQDELSGLGLTLLARFRACSIACLVALFFANAGH